LLHENKAWSLTYVYGLHTHTVQLVKDHMSIRILSDRTRTVTPYEYTHMVRTVRVRSKYAYGLEQIYCVTLSSRVYTKM